MIAPEICKIMLKQAIALTSKSAQIHVAWEKGDLDDFLRLIEESEAMLAELGPELRQASMDYQQGELKTFDTTTESVP